MTVLGALARSPLAVPIACHAKRPVCRGCGGRVELKDQRPVRLADLPFLGQPTVLVWHKRRWRCPAESCPVGSWTEDDRRIGGPRLAMTYRAGRWAT